ncbi:glycosyltransferase family 4 protein [Blastococcus sp. SYSU D00669]
MRVLFDAYWWVEGQPSGRRVVDSFLRTWLTEFPEDELSAAVRAAHLDRARELAGDAALTLHPVRRAPHGLSVMTELGRLTGGVDVVLSQNYTPLRARAVRAVFVHDLMFEEHPEFFTRLERLYFAGMPFSARAADVVLTSTAAEAARIARVRPRLAGRVRPVGLSVPEAFRTRRAADPDVGLTPGRFLLCVGRLNARKNVDRLIDGLLADDLLRDDLPLVVVGEPDGLAIRGADPGDRRVRFLGGIDDAGLKWLYEQCRLFVFPSLDEGFGLPVVEAALSGAPMVLSDIPAFRELAPGASFVDPTDPASIARGVRAELALPSPSPSPEVAVPTWAEVVTRIREALLEQLAARR